MVSSSRPVLFPGRGKCGRESDRERDVTPGKKSEGDDEREQSKPRKKQQEDEEDGPKKSVLKDKRSGKLMCRCLVPSSLIECHCMSMYASVHM